MTFKNFRLHIILRIIFLLAVLTALSWSVVKVEYIRIVYLGILAILLVLEFFHYMDKTNKDLNQFIVSIFHDDYTSVFDAAGSRGRSFQSLYSAMNDITQRFRTLSKEKETRGQYLYSLIEQVQVGIISYEPGGKVHLVNRAFKEMMDAPSVKPGTDLSALAPDLFGILNNATLGERQLVSLRIRKEEKEFSIQFSGFRMENQDYNLVSIQNIRQELDEREFEAWQKLIRVLTHEIMNSVAPIASLTGSLYDLLEEEGTRLHTETMKHKISTGLGAIQERSRGLLKFTEAYQDLARLPLPEIRTIHTKDLVQRINTLFSVDLDQKGISFRLESDRAPENFMADIDMLEQVIINLIRNAVDAVSEVDGPQIDLVVSSSAGKKVCILVRDNGKGIPDEIIDRIFVPFFTTKKQGSGIGLSLSRQIIIMHKGTLKVSSAENSGSVFEIHL
jgi:nitrogen fixation/metabolism regulation signal transduction histidine kinase